MDRQPASTAISAGTRNKRVALAAGLAAVAMLGAAYAAVPIYRLICVATGMGGTTQRADKAPGAVADSHIRIRFNATVQSSLPWSFGPRDQVIEVRVGEPILAFYDAANLSARVTVGTASFNVTPEIAGKYFSKIECFCFTEQTLAPGQKVEMPVTFFVDPAFLKDPDAAGVEEITLSYTFFAVPKPQAQGVAGVPGKKGAGGSIE